MNKYSWGTVKQTFVACFSGMALAEGMDDFTGTHHSHSTLNGIVCATNLQ